jgi:hypothetical protein
MKALQGMLWIAASHSQQRSKLHVA